MLALSYVSRTPFPEDMKVEDYISTLPDHSDLVTPPEVKHVHLLCDNQQVVEVVKKGLIPYSGLKFPHHYSLMGDIEKARNKIVFSDCWKIDYALDSRPYLCGRKRPC